MDIAIEIKNVSKQYPCLRSFRDLFSLDKANVLNRENYFTALHSVNLSISRGEVFGLLGPNGSGKTTLQKIICGLLLPESGTVTVMGKNIQDSGPGPISRTSYVFDGERSFYWRLTGQQNLEFFAGLSGCNMKEVRQMIPELAKRLELEQHLGKRFGSLSAGNKQKMSLIRALLTKPAVLVMDEPTRSLDPGTAWQVCCLAKELAQGEQKTIIWATHNLAEAESICDRIAIVKEGEIAIVTQAVGIRDTYFNLMHPDKVVGVY